MRRYAFLLGALAALALESLIAVWVLRPERLSGQRLAPPLPRALTAPVDGPIAGTASCAGRSCHGGLNEHRYKQNDKDQQKLLLLFNEYTTWATRDPHANAYEVLLSDRSDDIANRLGICLAHESERCLACHTNPQAVSLPDDPDVVARVKQERQYGVGCESCHGNARRWVDKHYDKNWRGLNAKQKLDMGMVNVGDAAALARQCAGCHVGAPPDPKNGIEVARDVNHDLIAAGHPRLAFEFSAFFANLPQHWKNKDLAHVQRWGTGQVVAAEAALKLLAYRADETADSNDTRVWPEFGEYDCFGCHHTLSHPAWRQDKDRPRTGRRHGSLAWGSWYFVMPLTLGTDPTGVAVTMPKLTAVSRLMEAPLPSKVAVRKSIEAARGELEIVRKNVCGWPTTPDFAKAKMSFLLAHGPLKRESNWDAAEQTYLALAALNQVADNPIFNGRLNDLLDKRAFVKDLNSPLSDPESGFDPGKFLKSLRGER